jgi:O-antigen/teichoic acid export membrane protein
MVLRKIHERASAVAASLASEHVLFRRSAFLLAISVASGAFLLVVNVALSRYLGPESFGGFKTASSFAGLVIVLIDLGIGATMNRFGAEYAAARSSRLPGLLSGLLRLRAGIFGLALLLLGLLYEPLSGVFFRAPDSPLYAAALAMVALLYFDVFRTLATSLQRFGLYGQSILWGNLLAGFLALFLGWTYGAAGAVLGWAAGQFLGSLFVVRHSLAHRLLHPAPGSAVNVIPLWLGYGLPVFTLSLANFLQPGMVSLLSPWFSPRLIGFFALAYTFYGAVMLLPSAITTVLQPRVAELRAGAEPWRAGKTLRRMLFAYGLTALAGVALTWLLADPLLARFLPAYLEGSLIVKGIVTLAFLLGSVSIYQGYLVVQGRTRRLSWVTLILNLVTFGASFALLALHA